MALTVLHSWLATTPGAAAPVIAQATPAPLNWSWGPMFGRACSGFGCASVSGGVATIGGTYWTSSEQGKPEKQWIADARWLGPGADRWSPLPDYPTGVGQVLAVAVGDRVFAVGGRDAHRAFAQTYWLEPGRAESAWQRGPELPQPMFALTGGVDGSVIYVLTDPQAIKDAVDLNGEGRPTETPVVLALDTADSHGAWQQVASAPEPEVGYTTTAVADGKLIIFGGAVPGEKGDLRLRDTVWILDLEGREWSRGARLPFALRDSSAVTLDDRYVVLVGGVEEAASGAQTADGAPRIILASRCVAYDVAADRFTAVEPLRLAVADHGLAARGAELLAVAGEDSPYRTRTDLVQRGDWSSLRGALLESRRQDR